MHICACIWIYHWITLTTGRKICLKSELDLQWGQKAFLGHWAAVGQGLHAYFSQNPHIKHMFKYVMMLFVSIIKINLILDGEMSC